MAVRTDGFDVWLYLRGDVGAVGWNLDIVDVRRDVMLMEFMAGVAVTMFASCVCYVFYMLAEESRNDGTDD